jgi:hypothetical protein
MQQKIALVNVITLPIMQRERINVWSQLAA